MPAHGTPADLSQHQGTGFFTINAVTKAFYERAHQTSAKYPEQTSEFEACGLTPQYTDTHPAPHSRGKPVKMGLQLEEEHHIRTNGTIFLVGKVMEPLIDDNPWLSDTTSNLEQAAFSLLPGWTATTRRNCWEAGLCEGGNVGEWGMGELEMGMAKVFIVHAPIQLFLQSLY